MGIIALNTKTTQGSMASDFRELTGLLTEGQLKDTMLFGIINDVIDMFGEDEFYRTTVTGLSLVQASGQNARERYIDLSDHYPIDPLRFRIKDVDGEIPVRTPEVYNNRMDFITISTDSAAAFRLAKITQFNSLRQTAVVYIGRNYTLRSTADIDYPRVAKRPAATTDGLDIPDRLVGPVRELCLRQIARDILKKPLAQIMPQGAAQ